MRVFLTGASGAIGMRLVPQLLDRGHEVGHVGRACLALVPDHLESVDGQRLEHDRLPLQRIPEGEVLGHEEG